MPFSVAELTTVANKSLLEILGIPRDAARAKITEAYNQQKGLYDPRGVLPEMTEERALCEKITARLNDAQELFVTSLDAAAAEGKAEWEEARKLMSRVIDLHSEDALFRARIGWYTFNCTKMEAGERERITMYQLEYALELDPASAMAHFYLGSVSVAQRNPGRAKAEFTAAVTAAPNFEPAKKALAALSAAASGTQPAVQVTQRFSVKKSRVPYGLLAVLATVVVAASGVFVAEMKKPEAFGVRIASATVKKVGKLLKLELGAAWTNMNQEQQERYVKRAFEASKQRGIEIIEVLNQGDTVARIEGDKFEYVGPDAPKTPAAPAPSSPGQAPAPAAPAPAPTPTPAPAPTPAKP